MLFGQFTKDAIPGGKAFGDRKSVSYHTIAENRTKMQLARRILLRDSGFASLQRPQNRLGEQRSWARIVARLFAVAVAQW